MSKSVSITHSSVLAAAHDEHADQEAKPKPDTDGLVRMLFDNFVRRPGRDRRSQVSLALSMAVTSFAVNLLILSSSRSSVFIIAFAAPPYCTARAKPSRIVGACTERPQNQWLNGDLKKIRQF